MFSPHRTSTLGQRALGAFGLVRSFLLLEDDYDVDWEVGEEEHGEVDHPHRAPLQARAAASRGARRRPGQPLPSAHVCLSPVTAPKHRGAEIRRRKHEEPGACRERDVPNAR